MGLARTSKSAIASRGVSILLLGGGALVLAGTLIRSTKRTMGLVLLTVGALIGSNATIWTLIVPVLALVTVIAAFRDAGGGVADRQSAPS